MNQQFNDHNLGPQGDLQQKLDLTIHFGMIEVNAGGMLTIVEPIPEAVESVLY